MPSTNLSTEPLNAGPVPMFGPNPNLMIALGLAVLMSLQVWRSPATPETPKPGSGCDDHQSPFSRLLHVSHALSTVAPPLSDGSQLSVVKSGDVTTPGSPSIWIWYEGTAFGSLPDALRYVE